MPATTATAQDRFDITSGVWFRTCQLCSIELPRTADNFYERNGRPMENRCQGCRRQRDAETRAARRQRSTRRTMTDRKFGVEMEIANLTRSAAERALNEAGVSVFNQGYTHRVMSSWKVVPDGSLTGGCEVVSPPLRGQGGIDELKRVCDALNAAGARVSRQCGLHVHHDVGDLDLRAFTRLFRVWSANQANTDKFVAPSRRGSQWARPLAEREVIHVEQLRDLQPTTVRDHFTYVDRYRSLNVACFPKYGTVEVRQHQGTTNFAKIEAWIAYGQAFVEWAKSTDDVAREASYVDLVDRLGRYGLAADQASYLKGRAQVFGARVPAAA